VCGREVPPLNPCGSDLLDLPVPGEQVGAIVTEVAAAANTVFHAAQAGVRAAPLPQRVSRVRFGCAGARAADRAPPSRASCRPRGFRVYPNS
jgi:hypothetical protein